MYHRNIRQSKQFSLYLQDIGWKVEEVNGWYSYIRSFPILGSMVKFQRVLPDFSVSEMVQIAKKHRAFRVIVEYNTSPRHPDPPNRRGRIPTMSSKTQRDSSGRTPQNDIFSSLEKYNFTPSTNSFAPSKTIQIDLSPSEDELFKNFAEAKQRGVRRALKLGIEVRATDDIDGFVKLKWGKDLIFSWLISGNQKKLWHRFTPNEAICLLAYKNNKILPSLPRRGAPIGAGRFTSKPLGGIMLLFHDNVAYYWQAGATLEGKKLFAPTLLVWEALKLAKMRKAKLFDFEGIWDERYPTIGLDWKGFTKFKEGFGGKEIYYEQPWVWKRF